MSAIFLELKQTEPQCTPATLKDRCTPGTKALSIAHQRQPGITHAEI